MRHLLFALIVFPSLVFAADYFPYNSKPVEPTTPSYTHYLSEKGLSLSPSIIFLQFEEDNVSESVTGLESRFRDVLALDLKLGYVFHSGFYFGMQYGSENQDIDNGGPTTKRTQFGFSLGFYRGPWKLVGTYLFHSKQTVEGAADVTEYNKGSGFQIDLGYQWRVADHLYIGPMFVYKTIKYKESDTIVAALDEAVDANHSSFMPMINFTIPLFRDRHDHLEHKPASEKSSYSYPGSKY